MAKVVYDSMAEEREAQRKAMQRRYRLDIRRGPGGEYYWRVRSYHRYKWAAHLCGLSDDWNYYRIVDMEAQG